MVIKRNSRRERGSLMADLVVAMGLLAVGCLPLAFAFEQEIRACRSHYQNAVAMEIVDGEMEILAAGEWRAFHAGEQPYTVRATAVKNLPPGRFTLTMREQTIRLEWKPTKNRQGRPVVREARIK